MTGEGFCGYSNAKRFQPKLDLWIVSGQADVQPIRHLELASSTYLTQGVRAALVEARLAQVKNDLTIFLEKWQTLPSNTGRTLCLPVDCEKHKRVEGVGTPTRA